MKKPVKKVNLDPLRLDRLIKLIDEEVANDRTTSQESLVKIVELVRVLKEERADS